MADYKMEDNKWNARVAMIESHMESNDVGDMAAVLQWNLKQGTTDMDNRKRYWSNITNMFATVENSPIRLGKASTLPQAIQDSLNSVCATYAQGLTVLFASHPLYGDTLRARGQAGYTAYTDGESYASAQSKNLRSRLTGYYNNYVSQKGDEPQWDGSMNKTGSIKVTYPTLEVEG